MYLQPGLSNVHNTLHGGATTTLFDGTFGLLFTLGGFNGVTANMSVNFRQPIQLPATLLVRSAIREVQQRKVFLDATLTCGGGMETIML